MGTYVEITPDPYSIGIEQLTGATKPTYEASGKNDKYDHVRRPVRGVQIKDETFATLEVKTRDGSNLLLIDSGGAIEKGMFSYSLRNSNFLIQNVQEQRMEKYQLIKTFGDTYIFFFGEEPRIHNITGILFNTADFNWAAEFWENYDKFLRGTQCVTNGTRVLLSYDDIVIQGYMLNAQATYTDDPPEYVPFSFQIIVSDYINTSAIGANEFPTVSATEIYPDSVINKTSKATEKVDDPNKPSKYASLLDKFKKGLDLAVTYGPDAVNAYNMVSGYVTGQRDFVADIDVSKGGNLGTNLVTGAFGTGISLYKLMKRVPPHGAAGSAFAFDQDHPVTYTYRTSTLNTPITPYTFGKIRENTDEYVGKGASLTSNARDKNREVMKQQYLNSNTGMENSLNKSFKDIGIGIDVPQDVTKAAQDSDFGAFSLDSNATAGLESSDSNSDFGFGEYKDGQIFDRIGRV